ncbi:hypothetical protein [Indiicoccus explosivorum]|uniref:hypothetical protein n=1 Tax=Indiicoccus explosivorum TaxID=1917864 RepID=UPI000B452F3E|nr:hypothetical protein [Indiicoccus explosivorum]
MKTSSKLILVTGTVLAGLILTNKRSREEVAHNFTEAVKDPEQFVENAIEQAETVRRILSAVYMEIWGQPEYDEDGRMVDEGALTSVQYFNKNQEKPA